MKILQALGSGLAGAIAVTLVHQLLNKALPEAPHMDRLGMRAIEKGLRAADRQSPDKKQLYRMAMAGDIVSNSLYYSLVGVGKDSSGAWLRGTLLGVLGGLGGVFLPDPLGLGSGPSARTSATGVLTVLLYSLGGVVSAAVYRLWSQSEG